MEAAHECVDLLHWQLHVACHTTHQLHVTHTLPPTSRHQHCSERTKVSSIDMFKTISHKGERQAGEGRGKRGRRGCLEPCDARKWRGVGCPRYTLSGRVRGAGRRGPCLRPRPRLPAPRPCASCQPDAAPAIQRHTHREGGGDAYGVIPYMNATYMSNVTPYVHKPSGNINTTYIHTTCSLHTTYIHPKCTLHT